MQLTIRITSSILYSALVSTHDKEHAIGITSSINLYTVQCFCFNSRQGAPIFGSHQVLNCTVLLFHITIMFTVSLKLSRLILIPGAASRSHWSREYDMNQAF